MRVSGNNEEAKESTRHDNHVQSNELENLVLVAYSSQTTRFLL
jgi:hypothetical protein